jgi:hypothetical protein
MISITNIIIGHMRTKRKYRYVLSTLIKERRMTAAMGIRQQISIITICERPFLVEV